METNKLHSSTIPHTGLDSGNLYSNIAFVTFLLIISVNKQVPSSQKTNLISVYDYASETNKLGH